MKHGRNIEKPKDFKQSMKNILMFLSPFYKGIIVSIILAFIGSIFSIIGPDKIKEITNTIVLGLKTGIDLDKIKSIAIFLIIIYLIGAIANYLVNYIIKEIK